MNLDESHDALMMKFFEALNSENGDGIRKLLESILNVTMTLEREEAIGAKPYERNDERKAVSNGFKPKLLNSRLGALELQIPQVRGLSFYPQCLDKGSRSERALKLAVAEMYLRGVSTRRVEKITEALCGINFSSTQVSRATSELDKEFDEFRNRPLGIYRYVYLDATYLKVRRSGTVINQAILIAYGINIFGKREILGASISISEAEVHWRQFLESLLRRGLTGVELFTSDDHNGLKAALQAIFPSISWQRCQFHMMQNAMRYAPKKTMIEPITEAMREIFNAKNLEESLKRIRETADAFSRAAPEFVKWLESNVEDGLTCFHFPKKHRQRIRTTNGLERVNREIKRRTRVAVLFPNAEAALRLVTGILTEIHEEWITGKLYLDMSVQMEDEEKTTTLMERKVE